MQLTETYPKPQLAKQMQPTPWLSRAFSHVGRFACLAIACGGLVLSLNAHATGWGSAASLTTGRLFHTSTLLPSGKVLAVGGVVSGGITNSAELYDPASNAWSPAASLVAARYYHTATLLPSGKVLVVAGNGSPGALTSAELYDPATNAWSAAGNLATARFFHSATLLPSGKVLVVAGTANNVKFGSAELYDPVGNSWSTTGSLTIARYNHTATLLPSGKVLVAAGNGSVGSAGVYNSAELFDPANGSWSAAASLTTGRYQHSATLLANGKVLIAGGTGGSVNNTELYDPINNTWSLAADTTSRSFHTATLLPSGKVLVAGGGGRGVHIDTELFDPASNLWSNAGNLATARINHSATLLASGQLLVSGGTTNFTAALSSAELYDPSASSWGATGNLGAARGYHSATLLRSGKVLAAGGLNISNSGNISSAELYDFATNKWSPTGSLSAGRRQHTATLLPSGKVLVTGGLSGNAGGAGSVTASAELFDPTNNSWSAAGNLSVARIYHSATLLASGKVLVVGGNATGGGLMYGSAELYDPANNSWSAAGNLSVARMQHAATLLASGKVLITAGFAMAGPLNSAELYDPTSNTWSNAANLASLRDSHSATLLSSGKVLVAGGNGPIGYPAATAELYDPAGNSWSAAGALTTARTGHSATLLPSGQVLVAAGITGNSASPLNSAEVYDPASNAWGSAGSLAAARSEISFGATLLPSGKVLISGGINGGGVLNTAELFQYDTGVADNRRPVVTSASNPVILGGNISLSGIGFSGDSEASGGATNSSATNLPLLQLRRVDNEQIAWTSPAMLSTRSATSYQSETLPSLPLGPYLLTLYVNALASASTVVSVGTSTVTLAASSASSTFGQSVTFTATVVGSYGSFAPPGGSMSFCDGGAVSDSPFCQTGVLVCASAALSTNAGLTTTATCTTSALAAGSRAINAVYYGDSNNLSANSAPLNQIVDKANQSTSFGAAPSLVVGATGTVNAAATSGLAVSFSTTSTTCTVNPSSGVVNATAAGNCIIAADQPGNANFNAATQVMQSIPVSQASSTTALGAAPSTSVFGQNVTFTASTTSNNASRSGTVAFTDSGAALPGCAAVALTSGQAICQSATLAGGVHAITATYSGDANTIGSANASPVTVTVSKANQSTTFGTAPTLVVGGSGTVSATATSALSVSFSATSTTCTVNASSGVVSAVAAGNCSIAADQPGNGNYNAATQVTQTIAVAKGNQTLSGFVPATPVMFGAAAQTLTATPGASSSPLLFSLSSGPCALAGASLSYTGAGSCVVAVNQAGDANYNAASPVNATVVVGKANQTIAAFAPTSPVVFGAAAQTLTATPGASSSPLAFSLTSGPCVLTGPSLSYTGTGSCVVAVNQAGDANYNAASPATATVVVGKANQTITGFAPTTPVVFGAAAQTLTATPGASSSPLSFSLTSGPCAISGASLSYTGAGSCVVAVNQAADANYNAASPATATVVVGKANQTITGFAPTTPVVFGAAAQTLTATKGASSSALAFSVTSGPCAITGASLSYTGAGSCVVAVNQVADANYNAASPVTATVVVGKGNQTSTGFAPTTPVVFGAAAQTLTATPGASTSPLVFSLTSGPCALASASLSYTGAGSCVVAANQAGDANYNAASPVTATVVVGKASQAIVFGTPPIIAVNGTGTVSATGGLSGNTVTFTSTTPLVCTVSGATVTAPTLGNCIIAADQLGNGNFNAAPQALQTIGVGKASQTITGFVPLSPVVFVAAAQTLTATPGASSSALVFSLAAGPCALAGANLSYTGAGACVVAVNQAGDANYNAAGQLSATVVINKAAQAIVFGAAPSIAVGGTASVSATGGASSNAVTFTSTTPSICTISSASVTALLGGNCIIAANQLGNSNYNAAPPVMLPIAIGASGSTMRITSSANPAKAGQPITFNVVVSQGMPGAANSEAFKASIQPSAIATGNVTFTDNGNLIATAPLDANGQASFTTSSLFAGNHSITATYSGDASNATASATVIQAVDALIVPTLSAWILLLLAMLLGATALRAGVARKQ